MGGQHEYLKERVNQHIIKNKFSKIDDANAQKASDEIVKILTDLHPNHTFTHKTSLTFCQIEKYTNRKFNIDYDFSRRKLKPDGGVIWMDDKYPILISEMKRQGTNDERVADGKNKQAVGNAIERLGKNLIGFKCLYENESILPFICFCWGCDVDDGTFLGKLYVLNSFFEINKLYTKGSNCVNKPFSCLTKKESAFTIEELLIPMLEVAESSIKYFEGRESKNVILK